MSDALPDYRITTQLGVGARSKINLAVHLPTGKKYAVKQVMRNGPEDDPFIVQAETEYTVGSAVDHVNLRRTIDIRRVRKLLQIKELYLIMELVEGLSLERARPNRLDTFLTIFRRVAAGLHALHRSGFVHTDLKPTNIMIAAGGTVKIIDFGQACKLSHRKERIQGTPDYIAPEQVRRLVLTERTDVFNCGATMYWVLTSETYPTEIQGRDPRGGIKITSDRPIAPIELNDKIPVSLSNLVMECCRENPAERPADMKQLDARLATIHKLWLKYRESMRSKHQDEPPLRPRLSSEPTEEHE